MNDIECMNKKLNISARHVLHTTLTLTLASKRARADDPDRQINKTSYTHTQHARTCKLKLS